MGHYDPARPWQYGLTLRTWRHAARLSQRAAAVAVGTDHTYLSKIETEALRPAAYLIERLGALYGAAPDAVDSVCLDAGHAPTWVLPLLRKRPRLLSGLQRERADPQRTPAEYA